MQIDTGSADYHIDYIAYTSDGRPSVPGAARGVISASADVIMLPIPTGVQVRYEPVGGSIYNTGAGAIVCKIKTDDGTTERLIIKQGLGAGETLQYNKNVGWFVKAIV